MAPTAPPTLEIYANDPDGARWGSGVWGTSVWADAGWQDVTTEGVSVTINWGVSRPERGILGLPDADTWGINLHDPDRTLDPGNPSAPFYADLRAGLPIRVSHRGLVVRTGVVESIGHHLANDGGYIRVTSAQALMVRAVVPAGSATLPDTLYARARAAIAAAGLNQPVYGLGKPGVYDDPPLTPLSVTTDTSVWAIITEAAIACLQMPYIDRTGGLHFRAWDAIVDRGTVLTSAELVDLSSISTDAGLYSRVEVLEDDGVTWQVRAMTPPPSYGVTTYRRSTPTLDAGTWAATVLADRAAPGVRWVPGTIYLDDADRLEYLLKVDMLERVTMSPASAAMTVVGATVTVTGGTTTRARWGLELRGVEAALPETGATNVISGVTANALTASTATINWTTSAASTSVVNYGLTTAYGTTVTDTDPVTAHQITLTGLTASTTYHFRVRSTDAFGEVISTDYTMLTTPIVISNQLVTIQPNGTSVKVSWSLSTLGTGQVEWGTTVSYGNLTTLETGYLPSHNQLVAGPLTAGTTYHYRIHSKDVNGAEAISSDATWAMPGSGSVVATLTSANTKAQFLTKTTDTTIDVIELASGTYNWQDVQINVDRTSRPLTIRPAAGATVTFVGPVTSSGQVFGLGQTTFTKYITFDGRPGGTGTASGMIFSGIALFQSGVIEPRGGSFLTFKYLTFQNLTRDTGVSGHAEYKSYAFYISGAGAGAGCDNILLDHIWLKAPTTSRNVSALQIASSGTHSDITISNIMEMTNYHYALSVDVPVTNLVLSNWVMTNCGRSAAAASIRLFSGITVTGSYTNIDATSSEPLRDDATGTFSDGGGNSGI